MPDLVLITDGGEDQVFESGQKDTNDIFSSFTVYGVGSSKGSYIPIDQEDGRTDTIKLHKDTPVVTRRNDVFLQEFAKRQKGDYQVYTKLGHQSSAHDLKKREMHQI